jgi:hypothetical protein
MNLSGSTAKSKNRTRGQKRRPLGRRPSQDAKDSGGFPLPLVARQNHPINLFDS